jgi:hypothetical protein
VLDLLRGGCVVAAACTQLTASIMPQHAAQQQQPCLLKEPKQVTSMLAHDMVVFPCLAVKEVWSGSLSLDAAFRRGQTAALVASSDG